MANRVLAMTLRDDRGSDIPLSRWAICCPFSLLYGIKIGHAEAVRKNETPYLFLCINPCEVPCAPSCA